MIRPYVCFLIKLGDYDAMDNATSGIDLRGSYPALTVLRSDTERDSSMLSYGKAN